MSGVETIPFIFPGQVFKTSDGKKYRLIKTKQVNWLCEDEAGAQWNVRQRANVEIIDSSEFNSTKPEPDPTTQVSLFIGSTVKFKDGTSMAKKYPGEYVVIKLGTGMHTYNLAKRGGNSQNQYFRSVPSSHVEVVLL